jgi:UDP-glucose 4-epimerase
LKALVTGGAGFIGSHLCEHLIGLGHEVVAVDDLSTGSASNLDALLTRREFSFVRGSILDETLVGKLVGGCDTVFHLAAAVGVKTIVDKPLESLSVNLRGTEIVVKAAVTRGARLMIASTSEVYGKNDADGLREDADPVLGSPLKSRWSYALAKGLNELVAHVYTERHGLPCVITRFFNVVGPRQTGRYGMVVPRFVAQALAGEPLTVFGDGRQRRCFGSVFDIVPAIERLIATPEASGRAVNLGGTEEVTIEELARRVIAICGSRSAIRHVPYHEAYGKGYEDVPRRRPDIGLARSLIGFEPSMRLDRMIASIVEHARDRSRPLRAAVGG